MATETDTGASVGAAGARASATFTQATHNMLFTLSSKAKWLEDLRKTAQGDLTHYQESEGDGQREVLKDFCDQNNRGRYHPEGSGNAISWNRTVFRGLRGEAFVVEVHKQHPTADFNPARDITARGLVHTATGTRVLAINIHPVAGATNPNSEFDPALSHWKNWALGNYMLDLISFTAKQMSREYYQAILLAGDYNGDLLTQKSDEWYYPSRILPSLYKDPKKVVGLDHLQRTHGSDLKAGRDWMLQGNSDHPLCFQDWTISTVTDYPGA